MSESIGDVVIMELRPGGGLVGLNVEGVYLVRSPGPVINQALKAMEARNLTLMSDSELAGEIRRRLRIDSADSRVLFAVRETADAVAA